MSVISGVTKALGTGGLAGGLVAVGAAAIAATATTVKMAADYQQSMNKVQALTGATKDQMAQYDQSLKALAIDTGVAPKQLTEGLYNVISAGYSGKTAMKVLELATKDAKIGMTDATTTTNALTVALAAFNVPAKDFDAVNGQMLRTVTAGKMTMSDYASAISKTSSVAVQYKDSMSDMNAVLATLTASGIKNANVAGTDYNNLLKVLNGNTQSVITKSVALNPAFDGNAFAAMSVADKVDYLNKMITSHGHNISEVIGKQQNAAAGYTMLSTHMDMYRKNLKTLSDQQANAKATQDAWAITQQGFNQQLSRLGAVAQVAGINIGSTLLPILTRALGFITDTIVPGLQKFGGILWNMIKPAVDSVGKALGQINWQGIAKQVGQIAMNVTPAGNAFQSLSAHAKDLGKWFTSSVLPAIRGAEPGFKNLGSALLGLLPLIQNTASVMRGVFKQAFDAFLPVFERIIPMIIQFSGVLANGLGNAIRFLTPYVMQAVRAVGQFAGEVATRVAPIIQNWLTNLQKSIQFFQSVWNVIWPGISNVLQGVWQEIVGVVKIAWSIVSGLIKVGLDLMSGNWKQAWTDVQDMFKGIWDGIVTYFKGAWQIIQGTVQTMVDGIKGLFTHLWDALVGHSIVPDMINGIVGWFGQLPSRVGQALNTLVAAAGAIFSNLAGMAVSWGANIIQGVVNGITSMIGSVTGAISNIAGIIADHLPHSPAKRGPLTQLNVFGKHLVETFAKDISSNSPKARAAAEAMASSVVKALSANKLQLAAADLAGDRNKVKTLEAQRRQYELILKDYKDLVTLHHDTWNAKNLSDPIVFASVAAKAKLTKSSTLTSFEKTVTSDLAQIISLLGGTATNTVNTGSIASGGGHVALPGNSSALHWIPEQRPIVITHHHTYQIHTMARNPAEVRTLVDMIEHEQSRRFRTQTSGYSAGGVF